MLLGKRPRSQMKRTASASGITVDLSHEKGQQPSDDQNPGTGEIPSAIGCQSLDNDLMNNYTLSFVSPRGRRSLFTFNSGGTDHNSSDHFLRTCSFCHRRLSPARDIYMYMGDTAFCSAECREQKIEEDERNGKCTTTTGGGGGGGSRRKERSDRRGLN